MDCIVKNQSGKSWKEKCCFQIKVTEDDQLVFVSGCESDEIGVFDMCSGQLVDLMTHEAPVADFTITGDGRYAVVSLCQARPGQYNKVRDG